MTEQLTKLVVNCTTGEEQIVPLTSEEIEQRNQDIARAQEEAALYESEKQAKEAVLDSIRQKLISGQPLTAEEADAILPKLNL